MMKKIILLLSATTDALLKEIKSLEPEEKLDILTLGALTNIASLIAIDPTVKAKIRVFSLGGGYDFEKKAWKSGKKEEKTKLMCSGIRPGECGSLLLK